MLNGADGNKPDEKAARDWLARAAIQNFDTAQLDLAAWLIDGIGGDKDYAAAFNWLRRAAGAGNIAAAARLAKLYRDGVGTQASSRLAAAWYIVARRAGLKDPELEDFMDGLEEGEVQQALVLANTLR
jgi:TPR repeat protein